MKKILCLSDSLTDIKRFVPKAELLFFQIEQLDPPEHRFPFFEEVYQRLKASTDLSQIDLIVAEYIEALPLVYFMRKDGFFCPTVFIPHTNAYPLNILFYFLLLSYYSHSQDLVLCGSQQAARGYEKLVRLPARPICTFGINNNFKHGDKRQAREHLGLPLDKKYLIFTGRFMNDKGLDQLLDVYARLKLLVPNLGLLLSVTHIDPSYYNHLAIRLEDVILFYRLEKEQMQTLYQSADLFVLLGTSIFETYGKSPMEAMACGIPAVLPRWDGFPYYVNEGNGSLVRVIYSQTPQDAPYSFATVDLEDCVQKCLPWLLGEDRKNIEPLPEWAYYDHTINVLSELMHQLLTTSHKYQKRISFDQPIDYSRYPPVIEKICCYYDLRKWVDLELKADQLGLIDREDPGNLDLLNELHDLLFQTMDEELCMINQKEIAQPAFV